MTRAWLDSLADAAGKAHTEGDGSWFQWAEIADFLERFDLSVHPIPDARLICAATPERIRALVELARAAEAWRTGPVRNSNPDALRIDEAYSDETRELMRAIDRLPPDPHRAGEPE